MHEHLANPRIATIGGTFNGLLHNGHKEYLKLAFEFADYVLIYINSDEFGKQRKGYSIGELDVYEIRVERIKQFLHSLKIDEHRYQILKLKSLAQLENDYLQKEIHLALVVPEYYFLFRRLNEKRLATGKKAVLILVKERTSGDNHSALSSSETIRQERKDLARKREALASSLIVDQTISSNASLAIL